MAGEAVFARVVAEGEGGCEEDMSVCWNSENTNKRMVFRRKILFDC